jgi:DNA-binding transcriptional LysR family regulator
MELRDIEIFLTLAEELHFGRTAERLHVSQARVSQAIKKQERRIGTPLFERTSRHVALTSIGESLARELAIGYERIQSAVDAATAAARGTTGSLTLGTMGALAEAIDAVIRSFRARHPSCELHYRELHSGGAFESLRCGEVDIAILWLPIREPDFTVGPVVRTGRLVLMTSVDHPLARRESVRMEHLGDHVVPQASIPHPRYWEEALAPFHTPGGRPIRRGPIVATWQESLTRVAAGECVLPIQAEAAVYYPWPGIVYLPIEDAPTYEWALIWRTTSETPLIRAFEQAARDVGPSSLEDLIAKTSRTGTDIVISTQEDTNGAA